MTLASMQLFSLVQFSISYSTELFGTKALTYTKPTKSKNMAQDGQGMGGMPGMDASGLASLQQDGSVGGDGSNNQGGNTVGGGVDANALLAQQQALMAMTGGDAGASRDALMNLLAKQGFGSATGGGAGQGISQMGMMGGMGAMNGMQMGAMNAMGQIGAMNGMNGLQQPNQLDNSNNNNNNNGDNANINQNIMANPAFSGFAPAMGGFQGGFPIGMGE
jgi:hypothetical protein